jgi:hypothetical protein
VQWCAALSSLVQLSLTQRYYVGYVSMKSVMPCSTVCDVRTCILQNRTEGKKMSTDDHMQLLFISEVCGYMQQRTI